jgi:predicted Co/Zn/Cd cation transporter (cation efflux family)
VTGEKARASDQSTDSLEDMVTKEEFFSSTNPKKTIRKVVRKANVELHFLIQIQSQTQEINEIINALMNRIEHYGVNKIFNYPNF